MFLFKKMVYQMIIVYFWPGKLWELMIEQFKKLEQSEINHLLDAIPLITILVAGADGHIEIKETDWAKKIASIRSYASDLLLRDYYKSVDEVFDTRMSEYIQVLSNDVHERTKEIADRLTKLNDILPKIDQTYAAYLYKSFVSFAEHIAKAAGGFLSFFSISAEEKKLIKLGMLNPIEMPEEEAWLVPKSKSPYLFAKSIICETLNLNEVTTDVAYN